MLRKNRLCSSYLRDDLFLKTLCSCRSVHRGTSSTVQHAQLQTHHFHHVQSASYILFVPSRPDQPRQVNYSFTQGRLDQPRKECTPCTDKKENFIFLIYKEIQAGAVAKSYMTIDQRPAHIWLNICAFPRILGSPSSYTILEPIQSEFPYIWGKFNFLFYQCESLFASVSKSGTRHPTTVRTYPRAGFPSCYRYHHRICMETWVNMHWCSAHRLHPWNRKSESVRTVPFPLCTNEKKLFLNGKDFSKMWKCTNVKPYLKKFFFSYKWLCTCFLRRIPIFFTNVQW